MSRYDFTRDSFLTFVKDLDERVIDVEPTGFRNTLHWHMGHVLVVSEMFLFGYPEHSTNIPEVYGKLFKPGTKPADWSGDVPSRAEIIAQLEKQQERINNLSDDYLATELPFTLPFGNFKTYGELYDLALHHEAEHLGQMKVANRFVQAK